MKAPHLHRRTFLGVSIAAGAGGPLALAGAQPMAPGAVAPGVAASVPLAESLALPDQGFDLPGLHVSFVEDFTQPLDISARGPSRWTAHTPWNGDFGAARFTDPGPDQAFVQQPGQLSIRARANGRGGAWTSGLMSSTDSQGRGFSQALGYFEASLRLPQALGVWPAFWLMGKPQEGPRVEVDVVEYYGRDPLQYHGVVHRWPNGTATRHQGWGTRVKYAAPQQPASFNRYGARVESDRITLYFNRRPVWQVAAPADMRDQPLTLLANLAMEAGASPGPHQMDIAYIRAWSPAGPAAALPAAVPASTRPRFSGARTP